MTTGLDFNSLVPRLIADQDKSLVNSTFQEVIDRTGMTLQLAPPHTPERNQFIERLWLTITGMVSSAKRRGQEPRTSLRPASRDLLVPPDALPFPWLYSLQSESQAAV